MLILGRKLGESIKIGDNVTITIRKIYGSKVDVAIDAPVSVTVHRSEVHRRYTDGEPATDGVLKTGGSATGDSDADDFDCDDEYGPACMSCGGEGIVDSVSQESGRYGWDDDGPGTCPNCNGSGLRKDQTYF